MTERKARRPARFLSPLGGTTTVDIARRLRLTPQGVSKAEDRVLKQIRWAVKPAVVNGDFCPTDPDHARVFIKALSTAAVESEENSVLADVVVARAEQILAVTGCTDEFAVKQASRELFGPCEY